MAISTQASDGVKKNKDDDLYSLKGIRTLDSDIKEYKRRVEKYGKDQASHYDPYIDIKGDEIPPEEESVDEKQFVANPQEVRNAGETSSFKDVIAKRYKPDNETPAEKENISFIELLKHRKKGGSAAPIYSPHIPGAAERHEDEPVLEPVLNVKKPLPQAPQDEVKDKETQLRQEVEILSREHAEWKQKFEYYSKNKAKAFEDRESFLLKKNEIENSLKPLLAEEKKLEEEIRKMQKEIEAILDEDQKREREKGRWKKEDRRQEVEHQKWSTQDSLKVVTDALEEKNKLYETLVAKELEAEKMLKDLEKKKDVKSTELRLINIKKLKIDIESNKTKLALQVKSFEDSIKRLTDNERKIVTEKDAIEEKEHQTTNLSEEKLMEAKRWEVESTLRKVEQERWQISDKQKRLLEIMADVSDQYKKIIKEETEATAKLERFKVAPL